MSLRLFSLSVIALLLSSSYSVIEQPQCNYLEMEQTKEVKLSPYIASRINADHRYWVTDDGSTETIKEINEIVRQYKLDSKKDYTVEEIENELIELYDKTNGDSEIAYFIVFDCQLRKHLSNPITFEYPFDKFNNGISLRVNKINDNHRIFTYTYLGRIVFSYINYMQYKDEAEMVKVRSLAWGKDDENEVLLESHPFTDSNGEEYYILITFERWESHEWAIYIRVAYMENERLKYTTKFFSDEYRREPQINGFIDEGRFEIYNGGTVLVKYSFIASNIVTNPRDHFSFKYDPETYIFEYDELCGYDERQAIPGVPDITGNKIRWQLKREY